MVKVLLTKDIPYYALAGEVKEVAECQANIWIECGTAVPFDAKAADAAIESEDKE